jgi:hypothetical protein
MAGRCAYWHREQCLATKPWGVGRETGGLPGLGCCADDCDALDVMVLTEEPAVPEHLVGATHRRLASHP